MQFILLKIKYDRKTLPNFELNQAHEFLLSGVFFAEGKWLQGSFDSQT